MLYLQTVHVRIPARVLAAVVTALIAVLAACALAPPVARANAQQASIMMDDQLLVFDGDQARALALERMKALGVRIVRASVIWANVAQGAQSTPARRRKFKASNPRSYPAANWEPFDNLVRAAEIRGITPYLDLTGPAPAWGHATPPHGAKVNPATWKPDPRAFAQFVLAVGKRYSGGYRDAQGVLPRVGFWSLWNEPGQVGWLSPQWQFNPAAGTVIPESPILYRALYLFGRKALGDSGYDNDKVLIGETSPLGSSARSATSPMLPRTFIDELLCANNSGRPYRGVQAIARGCAIFNRFPGGFRATGWAHHPYTRTASPLIRPAQRGAITIANISNLGALLDGLAASTHHIASGLPLFLTEFSYETNPPDPFHGVSLSRQAEWMNLGDFLAWRDPRVYAQTQFQLRDAALVHRYGRSDPRRYFTYQSGLYFHNDKPKPSLSAYAMPIVVAANGTGATGHPDVSIWGQARFLAPSATDQLIYVQYRAPGAPNWINEGTLRIQNADGFFTTTREASPPGSWRVAYVFDIANTRVPVYSRPARASF